MELLTKINIPELKAANYDTSFMMIGSCFAQNIGNKLSYHRLNTCLNPFGIQYNPASIALALNRLLDNKLFTREELNYHNGLWFSFLHHGSFSNSDADTALENINNAYNTACRHIKETDIFIITFGSSLVYENAASNTIVSNCHKLPNKMFNERRMTVSEIVECYNEIITKIKSYNENARFIFSVSPVRYLGYGAQNSQTNKATLLLACEEICTIHECASYFPAYEIMMDELRDYRFYASDMVHPNETAISYIWERFAESIFTKETIKTFTEVDKINKALLHKPLHPDTKEYQIFLENTQKKINKLKEKYPSITF